MAKRLLTTWVLLAVTTAWLLLAIALPVTADPQVTALLVKGKWGDYRIDITCPQSEDCESIDVPGRWPGIKVWHQSPTHVSVEFWDAISIPSFWVRVYHPQGGWVEYQVPAQVLPKEIR